jgi:starch-binding outer membrane protein, SusD/RagB family
MKKISYILTVLFIFTALFGCDKTMLDEKPPHIITTELLYTDLEGFETGLNGLYSKVRDEKGGAWGTVFAMVSMFIGGTDLFSANTSDNNRTSDLMRTWGTLNNPNHQNIRETFLWLYQVVNAANTLINRAENDNVNWIGRGKSPAENKNRVIAEARAIRAWAYRHLSYLFGDVPLSLQESAGSTIRTDWERTPILEVRKQIVRDLLFAENHIATEASLPGRITKGAVQTYLAEMYLTLDNPDSTLYWANQAINNPAYKLVTERYGVRQNQPGVPFMDMFYDGNANREERNTEALWTFNYAYNTIGGGLALLRRVFMSRYNSIRVGGIVPFQLTVERGGRPQSWFGVTKFALDLYEPQDDRFSDHAIAKYMVFRSAQENAPYPADRLPAGYNYGDTIHFNWSQPITLTRNNVFDWPWTRKIEGTDPNDPTANFQSNDQVYLRLAETYLLKAEAQLLLGSPGDAAETINIIRRRSNAGEVSASDIDIDFILDERGRELLFEEHRRHTLVRTGKWLERVQAHNYNGGQNATARDALFPIPQIIIDANLTRAMPQNQGY